jgi:uroporphyrinogen-III synthase
LITILSTKKLKKSEKNQFSETNFKVIEKKFIQIKKINFQIDSLNEYVIFTSINAVKSLLKNENKHTLRAKKIFCVGQKTKIFLEKKNFVVQECVDYAEDLGSIIAKKYHHNSFTFFSGNIRKNTLPDILNENNIKWNEVVVYQTSLNPKKIKNEIDGILFFSPSAVESYLIKNPLENQTCFCIGTTTAKALEHTTKNIKIASQPTVENVIEEVLKHYNKK